MGAARKAIARLLRKVESGDPIHITRRGRAVAVLLSEAEYARFQRVTGRSKNFWEQVKEMRVASSFEAVGWDQDMLSELRPESELSVQRTLIHGEPRKRKPTIATNRGFSLPTNLTLSY